MNNKYIRMIKIDWDRISLDSYLLHIESIQSLCELEFTKNITFFTGENGSGKSTLLEAIAMAYGLNCEGGTINYQFSTYGQRLELGENLSIIKGHKRPKMSYFFRAESFYNVATKSIEYESIYGSKSLHEQSHGESFMTFFQSFQEEGLYLMDEPEAALSPQTQLALFVQISKMAKEGSQFIIATHSPVLLAIPDAEILLFDKEIHRCLYEETDSYKIMDMFIRDRDRIVKRLLL